MRKALLVLPIFVAACGPVRGTFVRPDYEQVDRTQTVRLAVVAAPMSEGSDKVATLWAEIARKYTNDHRDFIVKYAIAAAADAEAICKDADRPVEGVLALEPKAAKAGNGVETSVNAKLLRCRDREIVWRAEAGGSWSSDDPTLVEVRKHYVDKYGEEVSPWVAPTFQILKATLETLPQPKLDEKGVDEKIDLDE